MNHVHNSSDYENDELEDNIINPFRYEPEASSSSNSSSCDDEEMNSDSVLRLNNTDW